MTTDENTGEEVGTVDGPDRCYRACLCSACGQTQRCTPENDFYTVKGKPGLLCECCFTASLAQRQRERLD